MNKNQIMEILCEIMVQDGPDGHIDGAEIIVDFIEAIKNNNETQWLASYIKRLKKEKRKTYFIKKK